MIKIDHKFIGKIEYKTCSACKKWLEVVLFGTNKSRPDGLQHTCKICRKNWADTNRTKLNKYFNDKYHNDSNYKIMVAIRARTRLALRNNQKAGRTLELLGCTVDQLRQHLASKFTPQMNWDNYGSYWHIDHIKPCAAFDMTDSEEQLRCFHYTNLQPLEAIENLKKKDHYDSRNV